MSPPTPRRSRGPARAEDDRFSAGLGREGERSLCAAEAHLGPQLNAKRFEELLDRGGIARQRVQGAHGARGKLELSRRADQLNVGERLLKVAARTGRDARQSAPSIYQSARTKLTPAISQGPADGEQLANHPSYDGHQPEEHV